MSCCVLDSEEMWYVCGNPSDTDAGEVDAGEGPLTGVLAILFRVRSSKGDGESSGCSAPASKADKLPGCRMGVGGVPAAAPEACQHIVTLDADINRCR